MIRLDVTIKPKKSRKLAAFRRGGNARLERGVDKATQLFVNEVKKALSLGGQVPRKQRVRRRSRATGKRRTLFVQTRNSTNRLRIQTGALRSSWRAIKAKHVGRFVEGHVITRSPYAAIHEFGGTTGRGGTTRIRARRYVRPTLARNRHKIKALLVGDFLRPLR